MRPLSTIALAAALVTAWSGTHAPQDDTPPSERRDAALPAVPSPDERLVELEGAWELTRIKSPSAEDPTFRQSGMMLITAGYLSIELHLGMVESDDTFFETYFQSGVHKVELDPFGQLVLTSALGAEVPEDGVLRYEKPGQRRLYSFKLDGEQLVLTNLERRVRLQFKRVHHTPPPRDIHGREIRQRRSAEPSDD